MTRNEFITNEFITEAEFDGLCKLVFFQLNSSESEEFNREVLNYAIYWQVCYLFGQPLDFGREFESRTNTFRQNIQNLLRGRMLDSFDILQVIDRNIAEQTRCNFKRNAILEKVDSGGYFKAGNLYY